MTEKQKRGFALMSSEDVKALAAKGGANAHRNGKAHQFTSDEARAAGSKGGHARAAKARAFSTRENPSVPSPDDRTARAKRPRTPERRPRLAAHARGGCDGPPRARWRTTSTRRRSCARSRTR